MKKQMGQNIIYVTFMVPLRFKKKITHVHTHTQTSGKVHKQLKNKTFFF